MVDQGLLLSLTFREVFDNSERSKGCPVDPTCEAILNGMNHPLLLPEMAEEESLQDTMDLMNPTSPRSRVPVSMWQLRSGLSLEGSLTFGQRYFSARPTRGLNLRPSGSRGPQEQRTTESHNPTEVSYAEGSAFPPPFQPH